MWHDTTEQYLKRAGTALQQLGEYAPKKAYSDGVHAVLIADHETEWGTVSHLMIRREDGLMERDWSTIQRIKSDLGFGDREAVQKFPANENIVDKANMLHLFVLPEGFKLPFGLEKWPEKLRVT